MKYLRLTALFVFIFISFVSSFAKAEVDNIAFITDSKEVKKDKIKIAVVNFKTSWGNKTKNLNNIITYCAKAGRENVNLIVFPETALSGYDNDKKHDKLNKMHVKLAEPIPGKSTQKVAKLAKKYNMYVVFGMPERDGDKVYNSAAIIYPDGKIESYRKLHLPFDEKEWAEIGDYPKLIDTEWGKIGVTICYDTYCFPEIIRYYKAMGARLLLNVTACPDRACTLGSAMITLPAYALTNYIYIASSNISGKEPTSNFRGGSCIIGPNETHSNYKIYAGRMFGDKYSAKHDLIIGEIDLSLPDKYTQIPLYDGDWRPDLYIRMYSEYKNNR